MSDQKAKKVTIDKDMKNWCRICMTKKKPLWPLYKYKMSGNFAEMLTAIADVKVSADDGLPDKLCTKCCSTLEKAYVLKTMAERSDKKLRMLLPKLKIQTKKLAFNSLSDIKGEFKSLNIKNEPKWDYEVEVLNVDNKNILDPSQEAKDIVIANTVIRKCDGTEDSKQKKNFFQEDPDITWKSKSMKNEDEDDNDVEFLDETFFNDDDDADYVPTEKIKKKGKFKKPKLCDIKVFKDNAVVKKVKILNKGKNSLITCYSVNKNGSRGKPIVLKRPKVNLLLHFPDSVNKNGSRGKPIVLKRPKVNLLLHFPDSVNKNGSRGKPIVLKRPKVNLLLHFPDSVNKNGSRGKPIVLKRPKVNLLLHFPDSVNKNGSRGKPIVLKRPKVNLLLHFPDSVNKNGSRGKPIVLKRPKDSNNFKLGSAYKTKSVKIRTIPKKEPKQEKPKEKLVCPVCGILTFTLGNHMTTHQEKKKFTCTECQKSFSQKSNLLTHMKYHSGIKDHICEVCGAGFYCQKGLVRHNLIHTGERPYACTLCPKRFIARCDLNRHMKIHSGYKPFKCNMCTMSFNAKHQLQNHERMHTGERPYTCQVCNVSFSYKVNLNNHVAKMHGINLKFKSIHTVTEEVLRQEMECGTEARAAIQSILPQGIRHDVPQPAAHETVHHTDDYSIV